MTTVMSERDAFLRAIADSPDDDAPRLVFADWLDEHGEPERAEFIRVQCAAEAMPEGLAERNRLTRRADDLLDQHRSAWEVALPRPQDVCGYRRGFLDSIDVPENEIPTALPVLACVLPPV